MENKTLQKLYNVSVSRNTYRHLFLRSSVGYRYIFTRVLDSDVPSVEQPKIKRAGKKREVVYLNLKLSNTRFTIKFTIWPVTYLVSFSAISIPYEKLKPPWKDEFAETTLRTRVLNNIRS